MEYTLEDVCNRISEKLNTSRGRFARTVASDAISIKYPYAGLVSTAFNSFLDEFDAYKVNKLLQGLSRNLDTERQINELYNYVSSSSERAFIIGNIFRETINAQTPKACVLYGYIISDHIGENARAFTQDELIVCNALVTATDFDIKNFKILMDKCVTSNEKGERKVAYSETDIEVKNALNELNNTCSWCVYNRIFTSDPRKLFQIEDENLLLDASFDVARPADILLKYINAVQQIFEYGDGSI